VNACPWKSALDLSFEDERAGDLAEAREVRAAPVSDPGSGLFGKVRRLRRHAAPLSRFSSRTSDLKSPQTREATRFHSQVRANALTRASAADRASSQAS
jgi:hypothetical protein